MVNVGLNIVSLLGILLALFGLLLPFLGASFRRPFRLENLIQDIILAFIYFLVGGILFFQGWRLDPVLQFMQVLLIGSTIYLTIKNIRVRR
ncbi:Ycf66 family protein [Kovacikia minuta CCNUW1]|uniref:Ycf66 family protein n=1 Tax=Kovacikia minuta TaxID=2931930 RepID=UPI001CCB85EF|nr:Ycf66 family protein [Kovacikia minuta]UBF23806.1 Ycf66 family protein [Kovacikia minuta CCNUW1]